MVVDHAAPMIPNLGIKKTFKSMFKITDPMLRRAYICGLPRPMRSFARIFHPLIAIVPINNILNGRIEPEYALEKSKTINQWLMRIRKIAAKSVINKVVRQTRGVNSFNLFLSVSEDTLGKSTVAIELVISQSF